MIIALYELVGLAGYVFSATINAVLEFVVGPLVTFFLDQIASGSI